MKRKIFYAAMLAVLLVSCEKKQPVAEEGGKETVSLEVRLVSEETKAAGQGRGRRSGRAILLHLRL